jgi:hypothetical protein
MSGLEPLIIPALIGSTAVGTATSIYGQQMAGAEARRAAEFEAQQLERQSKAYQTQAAQDEANRRGDLESSLETIQVMRAGRGLSLDSPTGAAILTSTTDRAERDITASKANILGRASNAELAASETRRKGDASLLAADIGSLTTLASGVGKIASAGRYKYGQAGYASWPAPGFRSPRTTMC